MTERTATLTKRSDALTTRRAKDTDAWGIKALIDRHVASGTLLPRTLDFISDYAHEFIVAVDGEEIVGCVHLDEYAPSLAELRSLAVDPRYQGKGVGRELVLATEKLATARGYATLFAVSNDEEFFKRFGFEKRHIPELDLERSEVSRFKGVHAKDLHASSP
ncbi:MAG: GNAT family N-acetyltransferase [Gemmatimonadota bacterium]|nr:GNAT family N-acetyltransferase [Gemmatimonadota bacterium]